MQWHRIDTFYTLTGYRSPAQVWSQGENHHTHAKNKTKKYLQTHHYSNQKRKWKNVHRGILECPSEEVVFISTGCTSIYQMVRSTYTKANVWCKPQGKQQKLGKEKSPISVFPARHPQNSCLPTALENRGLKWLSQEMGLELQIGPHLLCGERPSGDGCVGEWVGGWMDGRHKSWERIQALRRKKQPLTFCIQSGGFWSWLRIGGEVFPALH